MFQNILHIVRSEHSKVSSFDLYRGVIQMWIMPGQPELVIRVQYLGPKPESIYGYQFRVLLMTVRMLSRLGFGDASWSQPTIAPCLGVVSRWSCSFNVGMCRLNGIGIGIGQKWPILCRFLT